MKQPPPTKQENLAAKRSATCDQGDAASPQPRYEQILDVLGSLWNIRESRPTKHGFPLLFGYPAVTPLHRRKPAGNYHLIASPGLVKYWQDCHQIGGAIFDLPAGGSTITRLRQRLRRQSISLRPVLPREPKPHLTQQAIRDFAARFDVTLEVAQDWHFFLLDPLTRPHEWWTEPAALAVFRSPVSLREMAETFRISEAQAGRLRQRVLALE